MAIRQRSRRLAEAISAVRPGRGRHRTRRGPRNTRLQRPRIPVGDRPAARLRLHPRLSGRHRRQSSLSPLAAQLHPIMAMAVRVTIVEVEQDILPVGAIDPDDVHTSGFLCTGSSGSRRRPKDGGRSDQGVSRRERKSQGTDPPADVRPVGNGIRGRLDRQSRDRHPDPVLEFRFRR